MKMNTDNFSSLAPFLMIHCLNPFPEKEKKKRPFLHKLVHPHITDKEYFREVEERERARYAEAMREIEALIEERKKMFDE